MGNLVVLCNYVCILAGEYGNNKIISIFGDDRKGIIQNNFILS
jgi:hypothetical protein